MRSPGAIVAAGFLVALAVSGALAAQVTHIVTMPSEDFVPYYLEIQPGETVNWRNTGGQGHDVTSFDGLFASPVLANGDSFSFTFPTAGTYGYYCTIHPSTMVATIVVVGAADPPPTSSPPTVPPPSPPATEPTSTTAPAAMTATPSPAALPSLVAQSPVATATATPTPTLARPPSLPPVSALNTPSRPAPRDAEATQTAEDDSRPGIPFLLEAALAGSLLIVVVATLLLRRR